MVAVVEGEQLEDVSAGGTLRGPPPNDEPAPGKRAQAQKAAARAAVTGTIKAAPSAPAKPMPAAPALPALSCSSGSSSRVVVPVAAAPQAGRPCPATAAWAPPKPVSAYGDGEPVGVAGDQKIDEAVELILSRRRAAKEKEEAEAAAAAATAAAAEGEEVEGHIVLSMTPDHHPAPDVAAWQDHCDRSAAALKAAAQAAVAGAACLLCFGDAKKPWAWFEGIQVEVDSTPPGSPPTEPTSTPGSTPRRSSVESRLEQALHREEVLRREILALKRESSAAALPFPPPPPSNTGSLLAGACVQSWSCTSDASTSFDPCEGRRQVSSTLDSFPPSERPSAPPPAPVALSHLGPVITLAVGHGEILLFPLVTKEGDWLLSRPTADPVSPAVLASLQIQEYSAARNVGLLIGVLWYPLRYCCLRSLPEKAGAQKGTGLHLAGLSSLSFVAGVVLYLFDGAPKAVAFACFAAAIVLFCVALFLYRRGRVKKARFLGKESIEQAHKRLVKKQRQKIVVP
ncbi:hypothetical protein DIPPA_12882 [Diplonema papillatum]|nr:hypothetical protein DIPPA_12882 [Diplonema papillatum]